ncbi:unnamed protein product [Chironomus riparius]|uniref:Uncharacterized protein n=1 Tax=Chironomus riparius TaxID=315576 RepID=A0A9N9RIT7_9DIPT|nr:unnamed protein product [Chironomus riparius]
MNKSVLFCAFVMLIAAATAQWNGQPGYPPFPQPPNINDLCNRPGANCNVQSRFAEESSYTDHRGNSQKFSRVCDDKGCYERKLTNDSSSMSVSFILISTAAIIAVMKSLIH